MCRLSARALNPGITLVAPDRSPHTGCYRSPFETLEELPRAGSDRAAGSLRRLQARRCHAKLMQVETAVDCFGILRTPCDAVAGRERPRAALPCRLFAGTTLLEVEKTCPAR